MTKNSIEDLIHLLERLEVDAERIKKQITETRSSLSNRKNVESAEKSRVGKSENCVNNSTNDLHFYCYDYHFSSNTFLVNILALPHYVVKCPIIFSLLHLLGKYFMV